MRITFHLLLGYLCLTVTSNGAVADERVVDADLIVNTLSRVSHDRTGGGDDDVHSVRGRQTGFTFAENRIWFDEVRNAFCLDATYQVKEGRSNYTRLAKRTIENVLDLTAVYGPHWKLVEWEFLKNGDDKLYFSNDVLLSGQQHGFVNVAAGQAGRRAADRVKASRWQEFHVKVDGPGDDRENIGFAGRIPVRLTLRRSAELSEADRMKAIAYRWAPVHIQDVDATGRDALGGRSDFVTAFNYDGNWTGLNNWESLPHHEARATVYWSITSTDNYWFIIYAFYHPRDWCQPPAPRRLDSHEHDLEGAMLIIERQDTEDAIADGRLLGAITVFHREFYSFVAPESPLIAGDEDIDGRCRFMVDGGVKRAVTAQEARGHGCKMWPAIKINGGDGIAYLPTSAATGEVPGHNNQRDVRYALTGLCEPGGLWARRNDPSVYAEFGVFRGDGDFKHNAAHAPWRWDDHDDGVPAGMLALDPLMICEEYFDGWPSPLDQERYNHHPYRSSAFTE